jgi:hypothetical protein
VSFLVLLPVLLDLGIRIGLLSGIPSDPIGIGVPVLTSLIKVRVLIESSSNLVKLLEFLVAILSCPEEGAPFVRMAATTEATVLT